MLTLTSPDAPGSKYRVAATGEPIIITKNGQPICQLVPYRCKPKTLYGALQGSIGITGDLIAPRGVAWESLQ